MRNDLILIASADNNWGLGKNNQLLKPIPEDLKRFSGFTRGNLIIVGRKTLESFKEQKPLPDRINVVVTRDRGYVCEGAVIVHDMEALSKVIQDFNGRIYVCGGETIYRQLLPYCKKALITKIDESFEADAYLANLDEASDWDKTLVGEWQESRAGVRFKYVEYERKSLVRF